MGRANVMRAEKQDVMSVGLEEPDFDGVSREGEEKMQAGRPHHNRNQKPEAP